MENTIPISNNNAQTKRSVVTADKLVTMIVNLDLIIRKLYTLLSIIYVRRGDSRLRRIGNGKFNKYLPTYISDPLWVLTILIIIPDLEPAILKCCDKCS